MACNKGKLFFQRQTLDARMRQIYYHTKSDDWHEKQIVF